MGQGSWTLNLEHWSHSFQKIKEYCRQLTTTLNIFLAPLTSYLTGKIQIRSEEILSVNQQTYDVPHNILHSSIHNEIVFMHLLHSS